MTLEQRKEKILDFILEDEVFNSSCMYSLIKKGIFDKFLVKMDDVPIVSIVDKTDIYTSEKHFACPLWRLINAINDDYLVGSNLVLVVENIIDGCPDDYLVEYLLSKHYFGDNNFIDFTKFQIARIEVCNFVSNFKYFDKELQK